MNTAATQAADEELGNLCAVKTCGVFAWKNANQIDDPSEDYAVARAFLDHAVNAGLAGVKIDFINSESKRKLILNVASSSFVRSGD